MSGTPHLRLVDGAPPDPADTLAACLASGQPEVVLAGYAGAGKTTLVKQLRGALLQAAPTNKAARRLKDVTGRDTTTIHSLIYGQATEEWVKPDGEVCKGWNDGDGNRHEAPGCPGCKCTSRLSFGPPKALEGARVLIVDEASMVSKTMADDIRRAADGRQILWVGDPAQLPPVRATHGVDLHSPDVLLTKVWRADGGILKLATRIRESQGWDELNYALADTYPDVVIARGAASEVAEWRCGDPLRMAITHTNRDRQGVNADVRRRLAPGRAAAGRAGQLVAGDRLLIRQNVYGDGGIVIMANSEVYAALATEPIPDTPYIAVTGQLDGEPAAAQRRFVIHPEFLGATDPDAWGRQSRQMRDELRPITRRCSACRGSLNCAECGAVVSKPFPGSDHRGWCSDCDGPRDIFPSAIEPGPCRCGPFAGLPEVNAQYGYAITAHAAQGSEAEEVGVLWTPQSHRHGKFEDARSWLYTAVTRARSKLWVWR